MSAYEPITILMVDETPGKLLTYEAMLSELGEHLLKAGSAREALAHLLRTDIALILIDVNHAQARWLGTRQAHPCALPLPADGDHLPLR